ncbi:hypothetical protein N7488_010349 [Penicillium malachiteum]|nr:hypothetical protein N7488_010349 [Penicillium malachiteum]
MDSMPGAHHSTRSVPREAYLRQLTHIEKVLLGLLVALRNISTSRLLPSNTTFDLARISSLVTAVVARKSDSDIWEYVYNAVTEPTPPLRSLVSSLQQTPWIHKTSSFANSSEYRQDIDGVLKSESDSLYVRLSSFRSKFFDNIDGLSAASNTVFKRCTKDTNPFFANRWKGWPKDTYNPTSMQTCRPLAQPNKPIQGSTVEQKLTIRFVSNTTTGKDT